MDWGADGNGGGAADGGDGCGGKADARQAKEADPDRGPGEPRAGAA